MLAFKRQLSRTDKGSEPFLKEKDSMNPCGRGLNNSLNIEEETKKHGSERNCAGCG